MYNQTSDSFTIKIPQVFICDLLATDCRPLRFAYRTINYNLFFFIAYNASYANLMQMKHCCYFIQIILIISYVRMRIINNFFFFLFKKHFLFIIGSCSILVLIYIFLLFNHIKVWRTYFLVLPKVDSVLYHQ